MTADSALAAGRAAIEALMVDTCTIRRRTGETRDNDTGAVIPVYGPPLYDGKCRVQLRGLTGRAADVGEQRVDVLRAEVQVPASVAGVAVDDRVDIVTSIDPDLAGRVFRVSDLWHKTHATSRRIPVEEITS